jgi:signal transduction histidine kinase
LKEIPLFILAAIITLAACRQTDQAVPALTSPDYNKGLSFLNQRNDSAYYYFNKVATSSKDSLQVAMAYNTMAYIESNEGDYYGGQETLLTSLKYLHENRKRDQSCLVSDYSLLGSINTDLKNYDAAITYFDLALPGIKDPVYKVILLNNKALAYQKKGQHTQAIAIYDSILTPSKKSNIEYARVLTNLAMARWQQDSTYNAASALLRALVLRVAAKDDWGVNSSYAHLADYYLHSRPDSALLYAHDMYAMANRLQSPDDRLEALQKLIQLSPVRELQIYFRQYDHLTDSLQTARNAAKNQFALIRYEAEKNKAENLKLQQENTRQRETLFALIIVLTLLGTAIITWYRRRNLRLQFEARHQQLKTSQKVHDVVANGLYLIMTKLQHSDQLEKEQLLDEMDVLYEKSRNISNDPPMNPPSDFHQALAESLKAFATPHTRVSILGNQKELWDKITPEAKPEIELILQELMTNMKKHSGARNVLVRFEETADQLSIHYTDDGIGFSLDTRQGNGLTSTGNRIKAMAGRIIFDRNIPKGLKIDIFIPIG